MTIRRRDFITVLGGAAAWPLAVRAQQPAMPAIGWLSARSSESEGFILAAFRQGLKEGGYVEGRNLRIEYGWADGQYDRLPGLAADVVKRRIAILVAVGGNFVVPIARAAAGGLPIVFNVGTDPIADGLVASLNRPGGNLTGVYSLRANLTTKALGLLHELAPKAATVAVLVNSSNATQWSDASEAAPTLGLRLRALRATIPARPLIRAGRGHTLEVKPFLALLVAAD